MTESGWLIPRDKSWPSRVEFENRQAFLKKLDKRRAIDIRESAVVDRRPMTFNEFFEKLNPMLLKFMLREEFVEVGVAPELVQAVWIKFWNKYGDEIEENSNISEEKQTDYEKFAWTCARNLQADHKIPQQPPDPWGRDRAPRPLSIKGA